MRPSPKTVALKKPQKSENIIKRRSLTYGLIDRFFFQQLETLELVLPLGPSCNKAAARLNVSPPAITPRQFVCLEDDVGAALMIAAQKPGAAHRSCEGLARGHAKNGFGLIEGHPFADIRAENSSNDRHVTFSLPRWYGDLLANAAPGPDFPMPSIRPITVNVLRPRPLTAPVLSPAIDIAPLRYGTGDLAGRAETISF